MWTSVTKQSEALSASRLQNAEKRVKQSKTIALAFKDSESYKQVSQNTIKWTVTKIVTKPLLII